MAEKYSLTLYLGDLIHANNKTPMLKSDWVHIDCASILFGPVSCAFVTRLYRYRANITHVPSNAPVRKNSWRCPCINRPSLLYLKIFLLPDAGGNL